VRVDDPIAAEELQAEQAADRLGAHQPLQVADVVDARPVDAEQHVLGAQPGAVRGAARDDRDDLDAALLACRRDNARGMPKCRVVDPAFTWNGDRPPAVLRNLLVHDFNGVVHPVNPQADHVGGVPAVASGGAGLVSTARDYARYGFLYLNRGRWEGQQIVPAAWVDRSTRPGVSPEDWYGYLWHVNLPSRFDTPDLPEDGYSAVGVSGQYVTVIPSKRLVVVRLAEDGIGAPEFAMGELLKRILAARN
jgi:CubicO group peptidase (beta-lactamase class C family)